MNDEIAAWLDKELAERGWSRSELARRTGFTEPYISMMCGGKRKPNFEFAKNVADVFGMSQYHVLFLMGLVDDVPSNVVPEESPEENTLLSYFRRLSKAARNAVISVAASFSNADELIVPSEEPPEKEEPSATHKPQTFAERQAFLLAQEIESLPEAEQERVYAFMKRMRESIDRGAEDSVVPVDSDQ